MNAISRKPARAVTELASAIRNWGGAMRATPRTVRPLARDPQVLIGWPLPLGFGLDGRLLLARRGRVYV